MWYKTDELSHHGILGMHWGKRNGPPYPLGASDHSASEKKAGWRKSLKVRRSKAVEDFGKTENNNILYITGKSGSGKSTLARTLSDKNTNVIHLDMYLEKQKNHKFRDKEFDDFLKKRKFDVSKMSDYSIERKERWKYIDEFAEKHIQDFSKQQFKKNKKVIVEGVQLSDDTLFPDKKFFKDKAVIIADTSSLTSVIRANIRDNKKLELIDIKERMQWDKYLDENFSKIITKENLKKGKMFVDTKKSLIIY